MSKRNADQTNCCVYNCHTCRNFEKDARFHLFPRPNSGYVYVPNCFGGKDKVDRKKAWENILQMGRPASKYMRVCGKHFTPEDYVYQSSLVAGKRAMLKNTAVPSKNLPVKTSMKNRLNEEKKAQRLLRANRRQVMREKITKLEDYTFCQDNNGDFHNTENEEIGSLNNLNEGERTAIEMLLNLRSTEVQICKCQCKCSVSDKAVQVTSGDLCASFTSFIKTDRELNSFTGLANFELLRTICLLVKKYFPTIRSRKLCIEDRVVLVFVKMKMAIKFNIIAIFFHISPSACREIFNEYVQYISSIFGPCIVWPSIDECRKNIPKCFENFKNVRGILDCMEIPVQKPKCRCCRIKTYSHYRGRTTIKFMSCVSPGGLLTFISRGYGGRASDKKIFEQSGIINKLESHVDSIMVDKGFLVDQICLEHSIKIHRPLFLRKKKQFSSTEARQNVGIARARVHVERANQRIRIFEIFNTVLPWNLVNYIDFMFTIACAVVNLQSPILAEDKF